MGRKGFQKQANKSETVPCSHCEVSHKKTKLHNYGMHAEVLGQTQTHVGSLNVSSVSVSSFEAWLVDNVGFIVLSLTLLVSTIFPPLLHYSPISA